MQVLVDFSVIYTNLISGIMWKLKLNQICHLVNAERRECRETAAVHQDVCCLLHATPSCDVKYGMNSIITWSLFKSSFFNNTFEAALDFDCSNSSLSLNQGNRCNQLQFRCVPESGWENKLYWLAWFMQSQVSSCKSNTKNEAGPLL